MNSPHFRLPILVVGVGCENWGLTGILTHVDFSGLQDVSLKVGGAPRVIFLGFPKPRINANMFP